MDFPSPSDPSATVEGMKKVRCCKCDCALWANESHTGYAWCAPCSNAEYNRLSESDHKHTGYPCHICEK